MIRNMKRETRWTRRKERTYDIFEENISDEEEEKEEDLKLSISHKGEHRINHSSQCRLVPILDSPGHRCSLSNLQNLNNILLLFIILSLSFLRQITQKNEVARD